MVGYGLEPGVQMGPVITPQSKERIQGLIQKGLDEGAKLLVDGRNPRITGYEQGNFIRPTVLDDVPLGGTIATTEVFGPVMGMLRVNTVEDAIELINSGKYGNAACVFTSSGAAARKFRYEVQAGNIGINIGVPRRWLSSPSVGGRTASSARCTARANTLSNSSPRPKW